jgi:hypothetical protein
MIGSDRVRLGWFRDVRCDPPDWPMKPTSGQTVTVDAAGDSWQVEFFDPATGKSASDSRVTAADGRLRIALPEFQGSIAVRLRRLEP